MLLAVSPGTVAAPSGADAQVPTTVTRTRWLSLFGDAQSPVIEAFRRGLRELGYVEGQHMTVECREAEGNPHRTEDFAAELVRRQMEVIVASRTLAIRPAKTTATVISIVMVAAGDPVGTGLITSFTRPGGNITGVATLSTELSGKRLEFLKEPVPHLSHAVLWNSADSSMALKFVEMQVAAQSLGVILQYLGVRDASDVDWALTMITRHCPEALFMITDMLTTPQRRWLLDFAAAHRLPVMCEARELVEEGGLLAYGPSLLDQARSAAAYVDKLLKRATPADLPMEEPTRLELVISLKNAQALGLTIPSTLLFQADEVIH